MFDLRFSSLQRAILLLIFSYFILRSVFFYESILPFLWKGDDFNHYYVSSHLLVEGKIPYNVSFSSLTSFDGFVFNPRIDTATNTPFHIVLFAPLTIMQPELAWLLWSLVLFISTISIVVLVTKLNMDNRSAANFVLFSLGVAGSGPFYDCMRFGQIQPLLLLLVIIGYRAFKADHYNVSAIAWGVSTAIKFISWPLLLYLLSSKRTRREGLIGVLVFTICSCLPIVFFGYPIYKGFIETALPIIQEWAISSPLNWGISASLVRVIKIVKADLNLTMTLFFWAQIVVYSFVACCTVILARKPPWSKNFKKCGLIMVIGLSFLSAPVAWPSYYLVMLLPISLIVMEKGMNATRGIIIVTYYLIFLVHGDSHLGDLALLPSGAVSSQLVFFSNPLTPSMNMLAYSSNVVQAGISIAPPLMAIVVLVWATSIAPKT